MKNNSLLYLIIFFYLLTADNITATSCLPTGIVFTTQGQVDSFAINYPECTEILSSVLIGGGDAITNLNGLSQITSIGGSLDIGTSLINSNASALTDLTGLDNLTSIGGNLDIGNYVYDNDPPFNPIFIPNALISLNGLNSLTTIGNDFNLIASEDLTHISALSNLTSIGGDLTIYNNDALTNFSGLDNLTSIDGSLTIQDNELLSEISSLSGLTGISSWLSIADNPSLSSLLGLHNITEVMESLTIQNNDALLTLQGLENLVSLGGLLKIWYNDALTSLTGLDNLTAVGALYVHENTLLLDFEGLNNLSTVGGYVIIFRNPSMTSFSGLENLTSVDGAFQVRDNLTLTDISALQNLNSINGLLRISGNTGLSFCSLFFVCTHLQNGNSLDIQSNGSGCNSDSEILSLCSEYSFVDVFNWYDANQNGVQDSGEADFNDIVLEIVPQNVTYYSNAGILIFLPGSYTISFNELANADLMLTTDSMSYFVSLEAYERDSIAFGVFPTIFTSNMQTFVASAPNRCFEDVDFDISTRNLGTTIASGTLWFTIDEDIVDVNFTDEPDTTIVASNTYGWYFTDLYPGQTLTKRTKLTIPGPPDFELGGYLNYTAFTDYTDVNGTNISQAFEYEAEVRCSFDPNDKLVHPAREDNYTLFDEDLIYTIRFQNTGNDVAYDVVIRDTLDTNLDLESFNLLGSSHADKLQTSMTTDGILTFEFRDIFLPDSTSNLEGSQGYVTYMISAIDGLAENTPIANSAGIYFDFNLPVITNTTQNVMVSELPVVSTTLPDELPDFIITPNPSKGIFQVNGIPQGTYQIHDTAGRIIQSGEMKNDLSIDISREAQGVYFISIQMDNEVITKRMIKM